MAPRIFIDGHAGTTGLRIRSLLAGRADLELIEIEESRRKDPEARRDALLRADVAILCLPDDAAREALALIGAGSTRVIDASTAHRVAEGWVFGVPELGPAQRAALRSADRVSNSGCWTMSVVLGLGPLVGAGLVASDAPLSIHGISGYTGGGRSMIERWEDPDSGLAGLPFAAPYALDRVHKHIPEMMRYAGLGAEPQFLPSVGPYACGMRVVIGLPAGVLARGASAKAIWEVLDARYRDEPFVRVAALREPLETNEWSFDPRAANDTNRIDLHVLGHPSGHVQLVGVLDNLGKGAAGNAAQCLNVMLGLPESAGLER